MPPTTSRPVHAALCALVLSAFGCHQLDYSPRYAEGEIDIYDDLFAVSVADADHAVAAGYRGAIYWTGDGGANWQKGDVPFDKLLYGISMADATYGWAVGQTGTILRTEDGGRTWVRQPQHKEDEQVHLFGVAAIDSQTAWAVGEWGTRIVTRDGGRTWEDRSLTVDMMHQQFVWLPLQEQEKVRRGEVVYEDVNLNNIHCRPAPSQRCWIIGEFGYIFYSEDRGETWNRSEVLGEHKLDPIYFGYNEIQIGEDGRERLEDFAAKIGDAEHLNVRVDAYATPREITDFARPGEPEELFDVLSARIDETRAVLDEAGIMTDRLRVPDKPPWDYEDFLEDDPTFLSRYLAGRKSERPMVKVEIIQNPFLFTIRFRDEEHGLIAGLGGVMLRSDDGGRTWAYRETPRKQALFSVAAVDGMAVAVGEKGLVQFSTDGGDTWGAPETEAFPTVFTFMRDLAFDPRGGTGFIVGQRGMVLRSRDGGRSWSQVLPPEARRRIS